MTKSGFKKGGKSLAIIVLAVVLLLSSLPLTVFAEDETVEPVEKSAALALYEAAGIGVPGDF